MIVHRRIALTLILTLIQSTKAVTNDKDNDREPEVNIYNTKTKLTFAKLLKSIVKVNEARFYAMKRLTQLQDINVPRGMLRSADKQFLRLGPVLRDNLSKVLAVLIVQPNESGESSKELAVSDPALESKTNMLLKQYFNGMEYYHN